MIDEGDVKKAVVDFCIRIIEEPFIFFSESDLHFLLSKELVDRMPELNKNCEINLNHLQREKPYNTRLIHMEYGGSKKTRIDLSILSLKDVNEINHHHLTKDRKSGYLSPIFGFELGIDIKDTKVHIENDITKLMRCEKAGYIIHIYRDDAVSREGTKKRKKTQRKINTKFKDVIKNANNSIDGKIKIVAILLSPRRKNEEEWTKCEIFNKDNTEDDYWEKYWNLDKKDFEKMREIIGLQLR